MRDRASFFRTHLFSTSVRATKLGAFSFSSYQGTMNAIAAQFRSGNQVRTANRAVRKTYGKTRRRPRPCLRDEKTRWTGSTRSSQIARRSALPRNARQQLVYSYLRAIIGSTRVARRAGIQQAAKATTPSSTATATIVSGSLARTSNKNEFR